MSSVNRQTSGNYLSKVASAKLFNDNVIVEVTTIKQAKVAEKAGSAAVAVVAEIRNAHDGTKMMGSICQILAIKRAISVPLMAKVSVTFIERIALFLTSSKVRSGHFVEAQVLEELEVDFIEESEMLPVVDEDNYIRKHNFRTGFVNSCTDLNSALKRITEGACLLRTEGGINAGSFTETVRCVRAIHKGVNQVSAASQDELRNMAEELQVPLDLIKYVALNRSLPVALFASGGITTPADVAMMMQLGADGVFIGQDVFQREDPERAIQAMVCAVKHFREPRILAEISMGFNLKEKVVEVEGVWEEGVRNRAADSALPPLTVPTDDGGDGGSGGGVGASGRDGGAGTSSGSSVMRSVSDEDGDKVGVNAFVNDQTRVTRPAVTGTDSKDKQVGASDCAALHSMLQSSPDLSVDNDESDDDEECDDDDHEASGKSNTDHNEKTTTGSVSSSVKVNSGSQQAAGEPMTCEPTATGFMWTMQPSVNDVTPGVERIKRKRLEFE